MNNTPEINLTLDPFGTAEAAQIAEAAEGATEQQTARVEELAEAHLSEAEKKAVSEFAEKIDITNTATVLQYGAATQQKIANFSDDALQNVRTKDFGEVGDMVAELVGELKNFNSDLDKSDAGFFAKLFGRAKKNIDVMKAKYDKAEVSVNNIVAVLENHQVVLLKDVATLEKYGLQGMKLVQFVVAEEEDHPYRCKNITPNSWAMVGTHDNEPIRMWADSVVNTAEVDPHVDNLMQDLFETFENKDEIKHELYTDGQFLAFAKLVEIFASKAENIQIFFTDFFGINQVYNKPGTSGDPNWTLRLSEDFKE